MRVLIINHSPLFRQGIKWLIDGLPDIIILGDEDPQTDVFAYVLKNNPDVILIGATFFEEEMILNIRRILAIKPNLAFLVLAPSGGSTDTILTAFRIGAKGYLDENINSSTLLKALKAIERGEVVVARTITADLISEYQRLSNTGQSVEDNPVNALTFREREILQFLAANASNKEIAHYLTISGNTVRVHVHNILEKLHLGNRQEAGQFARRIAMIFKN